jgi:hypothetical protein
VLRTERLDRRHFGAVSKTFLFALTAALNPTLLTATTVMLLLPSPKRLMLGYLGGALTTGIVVGVAIVEWLSGSGVVGDSKHTLAPGLDFAFGFIALVAAYAIHGGQVARARARRQEKRGDQPKKTPRWQEALSGGTPRTTFVIGLLLSFPGASYLAALTQISKQNLSTVGMVVTVVAVNAVMLVLLEAPLISFAVAPEWTPVAIERFKAWIARRGGAVLVIALVFIGVAFIVRGVLTIVA